MRLIVETLYDGQCLEVVLTEEDYRRIKKKGICTEFIGTDLEKKYLNIFIRTEDLGEEYADEEGQIKSCDFREYRHRDEERPSSEDGSIYRIEERGKIKTKKERS